MAKAPHFASSLLEKLETISRYLANNRQAGHTAAMINGANGTLGAIILANNEYSARFLRDETQGSTVIPITTPDALKGRSGPLLIDNAALYDLATEAAAVIRSLSGEGASTLEESRASAA